MNAPVDVEELSEHGPGLSPEPVPPSRAHRLHQPPVLEHLSHERIRVAKPVLPLQHRMEVPHVEALVPPLVLPQNPRNHPSRHLSWGWTEAPVDQPLHTPRL